MDTTNWERTLIGTVIDDQRSFYEAIDLTTQDFQSKPNKTVWAIASDLAVKEALSQRSLTEALRDAGELDNLGTTDTKTKGEEYIDYLVSLADAVSLPEAVRIVREASDKERLFKLAQVLATQSRNGKSPDEIIDDHLAELVQVRRSRAKEPRPIWAGTKDMEELIRAKRAGEIQPAWEFPIQAVKDKIPGLSPVDFLLMVAPSGSGKSSFLRYNAFHTAKQGKHIITFSYENTYEECMTWAIAMMTQIDHIKIVNPHLLSNEEYEQVQEAWKKLDDLMWDVVEMWGDPITTIRGVARTAMLKKPIDLIQIDGAYLMGGRGETAYDLISQNMQGLRSLAQELKVPIMATTQFNRGVKNKNTPEQEDILYAGEKPARIILSIIQKEITRSEASRFKENYVNGRLRLSKNLKAVIVNGHVIKQTNGETGPTDDMKWIKSTNTFQTITDEWKDETNPMPELDLDEDGERRLAERKQLASHYPSSYDTPDAVQDALDNLPQRSFGQSGGACPKPDSKKKRKKK